jgi:hypothetical protein
MTLGKKPWYKSKTVWFNIITIGGAVAAGVVGLVPALQPLLTPNVYAMTMFIVGTVNIVLRAITDTVIDAGQD